MALQLEDHCFFALFRPEVRQKVIDLASIVTFPDGQVIFEDGDPPDCLYLVLEGKVEIVKKLAGGPNQIIAVVCENDYFGEYGVLDGRERSAGAVSRGPVTLARLNRTPALDVLGAAPGYTILELARHLINNIRNTNERYMNDVVRKTKMTSIGEMLNTVLHDFRNPFTVIRMAAAVIPKTHKDANTVQLCRLVDDQIERMKVMTDEILEFSRGISKLDRKPTPVSEVLQRFEFLNRDYLNQCHVELTVKPVDTVLNLDVNKMLRVLQNLVNNAAEMLAQRNGGHISITARQVDGAVEISVSDNGPGIPEQIRSRLFEPFVTHGKEKGIGLGLAITKSFVEAHDGKITVSTKTGQGTTFVLRFPRPPAPA